MIHRLLLVFSLILAIGVIPLQVEASGFIIRDIAVDMEGNSAIDAREKALNQARRNAFNILIKRNFKNNDMTGDLASASDAEIAALVDRFEINREKSSRNRYMASVNVAFNERALMGYMARQNNVVEPIFNTNSPMHNQQPIAQPIQSSNQNYIVKIPYTNVRQWIAIQNTLRSIQNMNAITAEYVSSTQALVQISYSGSIQNLAMALQQKSMQVFENRGATYMGQPVYQIQYRG
jgi:hypothetical protein